MCDLLPAERRAELLPAPPARSFGRRVDPSLFDLDLEALRGSEQLRLTIVNRSDETVTLIKPLDGSAHGWLQPSYEIEAFNKSGHRLPLPPRCGMFGGTYSMKTTRVVPPGGRFAVKIWLPWELDEGVHRVRVSYHFDPRKLRLSHEPVTGGVNVEGGPLTCRRLERAFVGTLTSPTLTLAGRDRKVTHMIEWVKGSLDKEIIRRISDHRIDGVEACFRDSGAAAGRVTVQYIIASTGNVTVATVKRSTVGDREMERCVESAIRDWRFPQCKCGGIVIVLQKFRLTRSAAKRREEPEFGYR
jgi:TonB family protein